MTKKKLQVDGILNELEGASLFFMPAISPPVESPSPQPESVPEPIQESEPVPTLPKPASTIPSQIADEIKPNKAYSKSSSNNASKLASTSISKPHDFIKAIRKTVRQVGKEVLFVRVSPEEKHTLGSIVYSFNELYRGEGRKTSENEVGRIGLNFLLEDYRENGNNSILAQVLAALVA